MTLLNYSLTLLQPRLGALPLVQAVVLQLQQQLVVLGWV
jgi:hypothetical protein